LDQLLSKFRSLKNTIILYPIIGFILFINLQSCTKENKIFELKSNQDYPLQKLIKTDTLGVTKEIPEKLTKYSYTLDNITFVPGRQITYDYYYIKNRDSLKFSFDSLYSPSPKAWDFTPLKNINKNTVEKLVLSILDTIPENFSPGYDQTVIEIKYLNPDGHAIAVETTGVIENSANIWMHPPRLKMFNILQIAPWPFIKSPYVIENKWKWHFTHSEFPSDHRFVEWEGTLENTYEYYISGKKTIETKFGFVECYVIEAKAFNDKIKNSTLVSFFNPNIGFVKMEFTNADGSTIVFIADAFMNQ